MNREKGSAGLIPAHGGYRHLKSFQVAQLVYDVTVRFCDRYVEKRACLTSRSTASGCRSRLDARA
jgi:hypothetical protein